MAIDPEKKKKETILAVVLVVVLLLLIVWNVRRTQSRRARQVQTRGGTPPVQTVPPAFAPRDIVRGAPEPKARGPATGLQEKPALAWKRDPFLLGIGEKGAMPTLQLSVSGIIYHEERPEATYAIINGEVYRIGDSLHGIKIIDIQPEFVRLKKFHEDLFLYLHEGGE